MDSLRQVCDSYRERPCDYTQPKDTSIPRRLEDLESSYKGCSTGRSRSIHVSDKHCKGKDKNWTSQCCG